MLILKNNAGIHLLAFILTKHDDCLSKLSKEGQKVLFGISPVRDIKKNASGTVCAMYKGQNYSLLEIMIHRATKRFIVNQI